MPLDEKKQWIKNCPKCGSEQRYSSKYTLREAIDNNKRCNQCRWNDDRIKVPLEGWTKNCSLCGKEQIYSCKSALTTAIKINSLCPSCRGLNLRTRPTSEKWKRICSSCQKEIVYKSVKSYLNCVRDNTKCRKCAAIENSKYKDKTYFKSLEYREKMSKQLTEARKTSSYGESFKQKCRINRAVQTLLGIQNKPNYNKNACLFIEQINRKFNWNLQHAENGGEKIIDGFFLDGYDDKRNIVFEYDEPKHNTLSQEKRDRIKERIVIRKINPLKFIRYDERYNKMYDIVNKEVICLPQ
jgi:hypothetical protein